MKECLDVEREARRLAEENYCAERQRRLEMELLIDTLHLKL